MIQAGEKAIVMGLGVSGRAAVRYLLARNMRVGVSEGRLERDLSDEERSFLGENSIHTEFGGHTVSFLTGGQFVVVSPGIAPDLKVLQQARKAGVAVVGELALAAEEVDVPVVAVTGTNGKTTVTGLIGQLLASSGKEVFVGGNIGTPLLEYLTEPTGAEVLVLELSSFQLEMAGEFRANVALLLNITPDHLDRHGTMEQYGAVKMRIFDHQQPGDTAIISGDDPLCNRLAREETGKTFLRFGHGEGIQAHINGSTVTVTEDGGNEIYNLSDTDLAGGVGALNAGAALLAVRALGCQKEEIEEGLKRFRLKPHRMEWVAEIDGVNYYNDSKATNSGAVIGALQQLEPPVILIAGGRDKGDDYTLLLPQVEKKVSRLILLGEAREMIAQALEGATKIHQVDSMAEAVQLAYDKAVSGETVLLSPCCASFDLFDNYGHRGEVFRAWVRALEFEKRVGG